MRKIWKIGTAGVLSACLMVTCLPETSVVGNYLQKEKITQVKAWDYYDEGPECQYDEEKKVLTIIGKGEMPTYNYKDGSYVDWDDGELWGFVHGDYDVTPPWDGYKDEIKKIVIKGTVTSIADAAFCNCTSLEEVQIATSVKSIGAHAFEGCSSLKKIRLDGGIQTIKENAFASCKKLSSVYIGKSVKKVYWDIFKDCTSLKKIRLNSKNKNLLVSGNTVRNATVSGKCGKKATYKYNLKTKTLTISGSGKMYDAKYEREYNDDTMDIETVLGSMWSSAPDERVIMQEMEKLVIGNKITHIGVGSFRNCKALKQVKIGSKVQTIGEKAFEGCEKLKTLSIGKSVKTIHDTAFAKCSALNKISVNSKNKYFAMKGNSLLNKKKTRWILGAFASNKTCTIDSGITSINASTIAGNSNIENIKVNAKNKKYSSEDGLLYSKNKKVLYLCPQGKTGTATINDQATEMNLSGMDKSVSSVDAGEQYVFGKCTKLEKIIIGKNMKNLSINFAGCSQLQDVQVSDENETYASAKNAILSKDKKTLIYATRTENGTYTVPEGVSKIEDNAFTYCGHVAHLVLSDEVTDYSCLDKKVIKWVDNITLGKNYYNGGDISWLQSCQDYNLKNVYVSQENPYYSATEEAVYNKEQTKLWLCMPDIKVYDMPDTVTEVDKNAFVNCGVLEQLFVSDGVTDMSEWETRYLFALKMYHVGKNVEKIETIEEIYNIEDDDYEESKVEQITVDPENKTYKTEDNMLYTKEDNRLKWCPPAKSGVATVASGTAIINKYAFVYCYKIEQVFIPASVTTIDCDFNLEKLKQITVEPENKMYKSEDGMLYEKETKRLIRCPRKKKGVATVASGTAIIDKDAFDCCSSIEELVLPSTITTIEENALLYLPDQLVIQVPAGMKKYYQSLLTAKTGYETTMVIKEMK